MPKVRLAIQYGFCFCFFLLQAKNFPGPWIIYITGLSAFIFSHQHILQFYIVLKINNLPSNFPLIFYFHVRDKKKQNQEQGVLRISYAYKGGQLDVFVIMQYEWYIRERFQYYTGEVRPYAIFLKPEEPEQQKQGRKKNSEAPWLQREELFFQFYFEKPEK